MRKQRSDGAEGLVTTSIVRVSLSLLLLLLLLLMLLLLCGERLITVLSAACCVAQHVAHLLFVCPRHLLSSGGYSMCSKVMCPDS